MKQPHSHRWTREVRAQHLLLLLTALLAAPAAAQRTASSGTGDAYAGSATTADSVAARRTPVVLELPVLDRDLSGTGELVVPTMEQSLALSKNLYGLVPHLIARSWEQNDRAARRLSSAFGLLAFFLPLGEGWLHEEWHRAVLSNQGIDSFNDFYKLKVFEGVVRVSHVADSSLVRLKREMPLEQVRLTAAGIEGQYQHLTELEKDWFFFGANRSPPGLALHSTLNSVSYVILSGTSYADRQTDRMNRSEGADMSVRDFAGFDFTAWVYDLHRPEEPYQARGVHPSGVGIDRYIKTADLTSEERRFLRMQGILSLLNLVNPSLYGRDGFEVSHPTSREAVRFNAGLRHLLTPFGYVVDLNLFLRPEGGNLFVVLRGYVNAGRRFPGVEAEMLKHPLQLGGHRLLLSPRVAVWLQPESLGFRTNEAAPGGLAEIRVDYGSVGRFAPFVSVAAKSAGWVAGEVRLDAARRVQMGLSALLP
jgi:hypothetical protein